MHTNRHESLDAPFQDPARQSAFAQLQRDIGAFQKESFISFLVPKPEQCYFLLYERAGNYRRIGEIETGRAAVGKRKAQLT